MIRSRSLLAIGAAAILAASFVACGDSDSDDGITNVPDDCRALATAAAIPQNATLVAIKNLAFVPDSLNVSPNTTVYWINCEPDANVVHTVTSVDGTWRSDEFRRGQTYSRAFPQAVAHPYYSVPHTTTRGTVVVR